MSKILTFNSKFNLDNYIKTTCDQNHAATLSLKPCVLYLDKALK